MSAHHSKTGPLFSFQGGKYLTRKDISNVLHEFLPHNTKGISSHSFRIGAASAGYPRWLIQSLGRWSSDCFRSYIRIPNSTIDFEYKLLISVLGCLGSKCNSIQGHWCWIHADWYWGGQM